MSTVTMPSNHSGSGATESREDRRRRTAGRRSVLMLIVLGSLLVVAVVANYGPVTHYLDASQRMDKAAAEVAALEERTAELQAQVGKLTQSGYLEDLARQQLSYALPGEELYVVTDTSGAGAADPAQTTVDADAAAGETATVDLATGEAGASPGARAAEASSASALADDAATGQPGLLERILLTVASLF